MFKNITGFLGGKSSAGQAQPSQTKQQQQPQFQVLTISDLQKLSTSTAQPPTVSTTSIHEPQRVTLSDGPRRSVPDDTYVPNTPDGLRSYAASIVTNGVSPLTPGNGTKSSRFDHLFRNRSNRWRGDDGVSPVSALEPVDENSARTRFGLNEDDYEDDPFADGRSRYTASSVYDDRASNGNPFEAKAKRSKSFKSRAGANLPPRLDTNFLAPNGYSPSLRSEASRYSNPFGNTPVQQVSQTNPYANYARSPSPLSATEPTSQEIRYSDCGVNPFQGLDNEARKERESSGTVSNIWDMIVGKSRDGPKKTMPSPRIEIDTSHLDRQSVAGPSRSRSLMGARPPDSAGSVSPAEWFSNILVHYEGRPPEISRAMSYIPTPITPHPPGLSPHEITSMAVPYLANIEDELKELRRYKADKEAEEKAQEERDRVRDLIHRQLANEQAIEALQQAIGGKRMTRQQLESPNIWTEIDLAGTKREPVNDRRSIATVWPGQEVDNAPPVPKIPASHQNSSSNDGRVTMWPSFGGNSPPVPQLPAQTDKYVSKPSKESKSTARGFFGWGTRREEAESSRAPKQEMRQTPIVLDTDRKSAKVLSVASASVSDRSQYSCSTPADRFQPSKEINEVSDDEEFVDEKRQRGRSHERSRTVDSVPVYSPPPYTRKPSSQPYHSRGNSRQASISEISQSSGENRRNHIRPSDLPKISTTSHSATSVREAPRPLVRAVGLSQMQFTPTTPHHARSSQIYGQQTRAAPRTQIDLMDIGFRSNRPADIRDRAEKKRRRQEKREQCFRRGGWFWMCGLCCGVSKMSRKLKIFWWTFFITLIVASVVVGAIVGVNKSNEKPPAASDNQLDMVTMPNFPPMPVGNITVTPRLVSSVNTCIIPSTIWSCKLPPSFSGVNPDQPIFNWKIVGLNDTSNSLVNPSPLLPLPEQYKNSSKIDGVLGSPLEGEASDFYVSLLSSNTTVEVKLSIPGAQKRSHARQFARSADPSPQVTGMDSIPPSAVLPTSFKSQQLRLFDRGLPTEHYKFMTYFDKTIYLRTIDADKNESGTNKMDRDGGVIPSEARWVCNWTGTRYVTKIYTRPNERDTQGKIKVIVDPNTIATVRGDNAGGLAGYAVQVEEDISDTVHRTGGGAISCFEINEQGKIDPSKMQRKLLVTGLQTTVGGEYRGCQCAWSNFKESTGDGF